MIASATLNNRSELVIVTDSPPEGFRTRAHDGRALTTAGGEVVWELEVADLPAVLLQTVAEVEPSDGPVLFETRPAVAETGTATCWACPTPPPSAARASCTGSRSATRP